MNGCEIILYAQSVFPFLERALMVVLDMFYPNWRVLRIHESSPADRGVSKKLPQKCKAYVPTHYFPQIPLGEIYNGFRCENLERLTFADETFDLTITQDVMEHILSPEKAFQEIMRTTKSGGTHIFTTPLVRKNQPSTFCVAVNEEGEVIHLLPPVFHGNPIDESGSLVTVDWGYDICRYIFSCTGYFPMIVYLDDLARGIRAEYIEVLVTQK